MCFCLGRSQRLPHHLYTSSAVLTRTRYITVSGPAGSNISNLALQQDASNSYSLSLGMEGSGIGLPGQENATLVAGTYTLAGAGGRDVGSFSVPITVGTPLSITLPATVNRSQGLTLNWTGGNSSDYVRSWVMPGPAVGPEPTPPSMPLSSSAPPLRVPGPSPCLRRCSCSCRRYRCQCHRVRQHGRFPGGYLRADAETVLPSYYGGTIGSTLSALIGTGNLAVSYQ